ncbi:hypothetical protein MHYP_G00342310 [Metynnis hypsauchen]
MRNARNSAPFWVAGLQQFCRDDGLVLYVCAVSPEESQPIYIKPRAVKKAFGVSPGFSWQTLETQDQICQRAEAMISQQSHTEQHIIPFSFYRVQDWMYVAFDSFNLLKSS